MKSCPFCELESSRITAASECAIAFRDAFPLTEGHTLVVPRQHIDCIFALPAERHSDLWAFVAEVRRSLAKELDVRAFNIGVNDGIDAGQTIDHAHIHIIPRRPGDIDDPRGGIRYIFPDKARYWSER
jgi:diadenosine tetraphosphate (Ap4A) HIT family hydrolase